eukprot:160556_1
MSYQPDFKLFKNKKNVFDALSAHYDSDTKASFIITETFNKYSISCSTSNILPSTTPHQSICSTINICNDSKDSDSDSDSSDSDSNDSDKGATILHTRYTEGRQGE